MKTSSFGPRSVSAISLVLTLLWSGVFTPTQVYAASFLVTTSIDDPSATACKGVPGDCSLRGAITNANNNGGANVITLPALGAGPYVLTHGVLDITNNLTINGAGAEITIISGGNSTPIFSIPFTAVSSTGLTLNAVTLTDGLNSGVANGGCIDNAHTLTLNNSIVDHCHAGQDGGGIYNGAGGTLQLNNSIVRYNVADRNCGGICDTGRDISVTDSTIFSNTAQTGAGLGMGGYAVVTVTNSTVMSNIAAGDGGGLYNNNALTLIHVAVVGNSANPGGQNAGGGGLYNNAGSAATISDSTFSGNQARGGVNGGGISIAAGSTVSLTNVTLSGNSATFGFTGSGGGIDSAGTITLTNVTLSGNSSGFHGGGIENNGRATLANVTFSDNASYNGGGLRNDSTATLTNVTFSGNSASNAGSGIDNGGTTMVKNTIVAASKSGHNCDGPDVGGSFNLSDDNWCFFGSLLGGKDNVNNLMLAPLGNYGGPTLTHIPLPGSFAIDNGTDAGCPATDQRGKPRPIGLACDVGAVERQLIDFSLLFLPLIRR